MEVPGKKRVLGREPAIPAHPAIAGDATQDIAEAVRRPAGRLTASTFTQIVARIHPDCRGANAGIASSWNAPQRAEHCLTPGCSRRGTSLSSGVGYVWWLSRKAVAFLFDRQACFPVPTWRRLCHGAQRRGLGGAQPPAGTRSAPLRASMARMASAGPSPTSSAVGTLHSGRRVGPPPLHWKALDGTASPRGRWIAGSG